MVKREQYPEHNAAHNAAHFTGEHRFNAKYIKPYVTVTQSRWMTEQSLLEWLALLATPPEGRVTWLVIDDWWRRHFCLSYMMLIDQSRVCPRADQCRLHAGITKL